jgi:hypothetical protein
MMDAIVYCLLIILTVIKCFDIRLYMGDPITSPTYPKKTYPIIINLNEPLINEFSKIDLFCAFDLSGSMSIGNRIPNLKNALNLLIDNLDSDDRLSLIPFESNSRTLLDLEKMTSANKEKAHNLVNAITAYGGTNFGAAITQIVDGIRKEVANQKKGRVQTVIFLTDGECNQKPEEILKTQLQKYGILDTCDITINTFGFSSESYAKALVTFSDSRDGAYYNIPDLVKTKDYVLNTIGAARSTLYKNVDFEIKSKYEIVHFYGKGHLSNFQISADKKVINNKIYQFITGKDYTYVLLVHIPDSVSIGETILDVDLKFSDFNDNRYNIHNYLRFYEAKGCFNCFREEYCRAEMMEAIEKSIDSSSLIGINDILVSCKDYLNENITKAAEEITNFFSNGTAVAIRNNYMYGVLSEGLLKRNGMNIWYSNEYQYELINSVLYKQDNRFFWERFHFPYWKISTLRLIHRYTGVPLQFIFILLMLTLCIPLSFVSTFVFRGKKRLIFNMAVGLAIQIILFDVAFLNVFISCTLVYFSLRLTSIRGGYILFTLFGYLMVVHAFHFYFYNQKLDFGASPFLFMFAIAKITFFTYAVRERNVSDSKFINQYNRYCKTDKYFPDYLEFLSYIYFFPSAVYGPCFQIKDYLNYVYDRAEYQKMNIKKQIVYGCIRIAIGYSLISLYYFLKYSTNLQFSIFKVYEYLASDDVLAMNFILRFLMIYPYVVFIKLFIYGFFQLIYGIFMTTGISYSEEVVLENFKSSSNDIHMDLSDKKGHCGNILKSDFGYNIGEAINHFNRSIHIYLKYCVYIRIQFLKGSLIKNYFIAAIFVYVFAALWCGFYFGTYFFFAAACIIYQLHFNLELFGFYDWLDDQNIGMKILFTVITQYLLSMIFAMLFLYKLEMTWCYLRNFYYMPFIIVLILYGISLGLRITGYRKEKVATNKQNRGKKKGSSSIDEKLLAYS